MTIIYYNNASSSKVLESEFPFHGEDSIELVKKKIIMSMSPEKRPSSVNEIYIFTQTTIKTSTLIVMQLLSKNFKSPITYEVLKTFCKNANIDITNLPVKKVTNISIY